MKDTDKIFISILFDVLQEKGVRDIVCSPGSRNTPLLLAVASRPKLKNISLSMREVVRLWDWA